MLVLIPFFAVKLAAYAGWCVLGLRRLRAAERPPRRWTALGLGAFRVGLGLGCGAVLTFALTKLAPAPGRLGFSLPAFLVSLTALRWLEWSVTSLLVQARASVRAFVAPGGGDALWRLGGVGVSFLTDFTVVALGVGLFGAPC